MRILFIGDIFGRPGRNIVKERLSALVKDHRIDLTIANGENSAAGFGITPQIAEELFELGIDVLTSGNHIWQHTAILDYLRESRRLLRPLNLAPGVPGAGAVVHATKRSGPRVGVLNLIGRVFMGPAECPFRAAERAVEELRRETPVILVDMHGEATSEKVAMGRFLDGKVSAVIGSHTHVQTADESILPAGTAYLTDAGMCGPEGSVLGVKTEQVLRRFLTQMPTRFEVAAGPVLVQGALIEVDAATGRATAIRRVQERVAA